MYLEQLSPGRSLCPQTHAGLKYQQSQRQGWGCPSRDLDLNPSLPNLLGRMSSSPCLGFPSHLKKKTGCDAAVPINEGTGDFAASLSLLTPTVALAATLARALATV